jgi:adenine phosphoribosyltransferase
MNFIKSKIRTVPDFPSKGIMFRDVTTLFKDPQGLKDVITSFAEQWSDKGITCIVGIDARGFIIGGALAYELGLGFVPIRKKGKLPPKTLSQTYKLEYGEDSVEILDTSLDENDKVLIVDDLIATGGTAEASVKLVEAVGAKVAGCAFVIDLPDLPGMNKIRELGIECHALCAFEGH